MSSVSGLRNMSPTQQVSSMRSKFNQSQNKQGVVSSVGAKGLDFVKRTALRPLGNKNNSTSIKEQMGSLNKQAKQIEQGKASPETKQAFQKQMQGTGTNVQKFDKANQAGGNIAKTAMTAGVATAATAAAPVTGGASLALGAAAGAGTSMGAGYVDKNTENKKNTLNPFKQANRYTKKDAAGDGVSGAITGVAGPVANKVTAAAAAPIKSMAGASKVAQTAVDVGQRQVAGGLTEGAKGFGGNLAREGIKANGVDAGLLKESVKKGAGGSVAGLLRGSVQGGASAMG